MKYLFLALSLLASNVYAQQIVTPGNSFNTSATGTTPICEPILFEKQTMGDWITGLASGNLKLYMSTHISPSTSSTSGKPTESVSVSYTIAPVANTAGVYKLCVTPTNFSWQPNHIYEFRFWVSKLGDNGSIVLRLQN
jgi:hypothetical protein